MRLKDLKAIAIDEVEIEELILARQALGAIESGLVAEKLTVPVWVTDKLILVNDMIDKKSKGELLRQLREAELREAEFKSRAEKRDEAAQKVAELKAKLGKQP